jgi:hypothetical protein
MNQMDELCEYLNQMDALCEYLSEELAQLRAFRMELVQKYPYLSESSKEVIAMAKKGKGGRRC